MNRIIGKAAALTGILVCAILILAIPRPPLHATVPAQPSVTPAAYVPYVSRNAEGVLPFTSLKITELHYETTDEYVEITNHGNAPQAMAGWRIFSVVGAQWYDFPDDYTLAARSAVRVHSGPDAFGNPPTDLLWVTAHMWNNEGDEAVLYNAANEAVDSVCYGNACP
jgi:hypothetical protein